ncbi:MAG: DEAD/DEAH box helicase family protein [Candidatus Methanomethylophilaceae archaeon]|nr:DEAD/DEAH box helicase family protein [Candidatus Methanomethylophilaceae archaeon]
MTQYLSHPRIVPDTVEDRRYQTLLAESCMNRDTLVILPTGLGKTVVALIVAANILEKGKKVLILAPTKPLVDQHNITFSMWLRDTSVAVMNGNMDPERRAQLVAENEVIIATPQSVAHDLETKRYTLREFGLVIYDEAHRGVGNYAYVTVASYNTSGRSMGMTASPGSDREKVMEVCQNLCFTHIEMRTEYDSDVSPFIYETYIKRIGVKLPQDLTDISDLLHGLLDSYCRELTRMGFMNPARPPSISYMLEIQNALQMLIRSNQRTTYVYRGMVVQAVCVKLLHCIMLIETQGMTPFRNYVRGLKDEMRGAKPSKSTIELLRKEDFNKAVRLSSESRMEHPKISKVMDLVRQTITDRPESKVMVFAQYRDMCELLVQKLSQLQNASVAKLIGQSKGGLKQKEQIELLNRFRSGECNILVSTSVGEEGLDVSSTDLVVFYEPVPSDIRTIQRRGRTGRKNDGEVWVMVALNTMDEAFESASAKREENMKAMLERLNYDLARTVRKPAPRGQRTLGDF